MNDTGQHPQLAVDLDAATIVAVDEFAAGLQAGLDQRDADVLNRQFAGDVVWGTPFGALVDGYDRLHPIHERFQRSDTRPAARYAIRHVMAVSDDVVVAHIARLVLGPDGSPLAPTADLGQPFSELAMYVLVRRNGRWWLAAGQHTPMRPGGAVPAAPSAARDRVPSASGGVRRWEARSRRR
jgi:uncharacterized protein (TIGR02246 family)